MSSDVIIEVSNLAKCYQIYEKPHHRLMQMLLGGANKAYYREFWALSNISFSIPKGRVFGILGKNGAGKSTLLQILCGTLSPSQGEVRVKGRVAALLELGSGFNPEFTGIENIYMNGQILGLERKVIDTRLSDILAFADIGDFVFQPVKTYSSGMLARLAFSVSIYVDPDVLIVDEALSVGDAWFQHKSMARMRQLMESGCTVLFVSHSIDAVRALCDEVIWLEAGRVKMQGNVVDVTNAYMNDVFVEYNRINLQILQHNCDQTLESKTESVIEIPKADISFPNYEIDKAASHLNGGEIFNVISKRLRNNKGIIVDRLTQGERFSLEFEIEFLQPAKNISVGFLIKDQFGQELTGESVFNIYRHSLNFEAGRVVTFIFSSNMVMRGGQSYSVSMFVNQVSQWDRSDNVVIYADHLAIVFDVSINQEEPMWFKFKQSFDLVVRE